MILRRVFVWLLSVARAEITKNGNWMYHVIDLAISEANKQVIPSFHTVQTKSFSYFFFFIDFEYKRLYLHPLFGTDKTATVSKNKSGILRLFNLLSVLCIIFCRGSSKRNKNYETFEITNINRLRLIRRWNKHKITIDKAIKMWNIARRQVHNLCSKRFSSLLF